MKLILAIVNNDDSGAVSSALTRGGFSVTKLATTGGFLMAGNTTLLMGVEDSRVDECLEVLRACCHQRTEVVPDVTGYDERGAAVEPVTITVGGAIVFVTDVERFEKL